MPSSKSKDNIKKVGVITENRIIEQTKDIKSKIKNPIFVGMDPSFTGFGIVILDETGTIIEQKLLTTKTNDTPEDRLIKLEEDFKFINGIQKLQEIRIEGIATSANSTYANQLAALHYYILVFFKKHNLPYIVVPPSTLKKFITGTGKAKKELMLLKIYKRWGIEFEDNNLADAYSLARMAFDYYMAGK